MLLSLKSSGNTVNAFPSADLNSICRNEVQTSRFEDTKQEWGVIWGDDENDDNFGSFLTHVTLTDNQL